MKVILKNKFNIELLVIIIKINIIKNIDLFLIINKSKFVIILFNNNNRYY